MADLDSARLAVSDVLDVCESTDVVVDHLVRRVVSRPALQLKFRCDGLVTSDVREQQMWPVGSILKVRFSSLAAFVEASPQVTVAVLQSIVRAHHVRCPLKSRKQQILEALTAHACTVECSHHLVLVFTAIDSTLRGRRPAPMHVSDDAFWLADRPGHTVWAESGKNHISLDFLTSRYHLALAEHADLRVHCSLPDSLRVWGRDGAVTDLLMASHRVACGSMTSLAQKHDMLHSHVCSGTCDDVLAFVLESRPVRFATAPGVGRLGGNEPVAFEDSFISGSSASGSNPDSARAFDDGFPFFADTNLKMSVIREFLERQSERYQRRHPCAVCAHRFRTAELHVVDASDCDLSLLSNPHVPHHLLPASYDVDAFQGAILYSKAIQTSSNSLRMEMCTTCYQALVIRNCMPVDALANFQYYAQERVPPNVRHAFDNASMFDLQLVSRARATRITYMMSDKNSSSANTLPSQGFVKGNVAILPQDSYSLRAFIPPSSNEIHEALCALFVSSGTSLNADAIRRCSPVLVSKSIVRTLAHFLVAHNRWYAGEVAVDDCAINDLYTGGRAKDVPSAIEVSFLQDKERTERSAGYASRFDASPFDATVGPVVESIGYTDGDHSPASLRNMKATALAWCLDGKRFLQIRSGSDLIRENHPGLLAWLFPHLDPFGIGGFYHPQRTGERQISFQRQVRNLILHDDSSFESDPLFAFVCWNIWQKRELNVSLTFRVSKDFQTQIGAQLYAVAPALTDMIEKWATNPQASASSDLQREALSVLNRLRFVSNHMVGTSGYKQCRRNEIRGLIRTFGTPALFVTINPSDVCNPLVGLLGDIRVRDWQAMSSFQRAAIVARRPALGALFFHEMMTNFLDIIVRADGTTAGLFGRCEAYYGMVEAQGRGTLHCHMLLWLSGNPNPQLLRDWMQSSPEYRANVIRWLETNIKCELPGQEIVTTEIAKPEKASHEMDPRLETSPNPDSMTEAEFAQEFQRFVTRLAVTCNWHEHTHTCWKHLKHGELHTNENCRMRMDGHTRRFTEIDEETQSVLLRQLHPWINNFHDVVIFLLKCNMDIKYIGSGPAAKALVFYITDYITKNSLTVHAGLDAVKHALQRCSYTTEVGTEDVSTQRKAVFVKSVHALMARQEFSHQQVMSYFVGGGDHYTGHSFNTLSWDDVSRFISIQEASVSNMAEAEEELINISFVGGDVVVKDVMIDYIYRPTDPAFENLSLWRFVETTERVGIPRKPPQEDCGADHAIPPSRRLGRPKAAHGRFAQAHPKHENYMLRLRAVPRVVVLTGRSVPRKKDDYASSREWSHAMLVLLKPWRTLSDVKPPDVDWTCAFASVRFAAHESKILQNFEVENECEDAREQDRNVSRYGDAPHFVNQVNAEASHNVTSDMDLQQCILHECEPHVINHFIEDSQEDVTPLSISDSGCREAIDVLSAAHLFTYPPHTPEEHEDNACSLMAENDDVVVSRLNKHMQSLRKRRALSSTTAVSPDDQPIKRRRVGEMPSISITRVGTCTKPRAHWANIDDVHHPLLDRIATEMGLTNNEEQLRAFTIVANHVFAPERRQLNMYIAGIGGSGKTHVINAVRRLFAELNMSCKLQVTAPTGSAAVLIGETTIHSLTLLPRSKRRVNQAVLEEIWKDVEYLIIDEISLISARLLSDISRRLCLAKSSDPSAASKPFGGLSVIFTGDFGQLKPVREHALFSAQLLCKLPSYITETEDGQSAIHGAILWRQTETVVELKKNWRAQSDPSFINLLQRVRLGIAWDGISARTREQAGSGENYTAPDYQVLTDRSLQTLLQRSPSECATFLNAPIIVAEKKVRDAINQSKAKALGRARGYEVFDYHSIDLLRNVPVSAMTQRLLWTLPSSQTEDALGQLPLFVGMPVIITENLALDNGVVNGCEGTVESIKYTVDELSRRRASCVYVRIANSNVCAVEHDPDLVPIMPVPVYYKYKGENQRSYSIQRLQLPLLPAFAFTDYKAQGRTFDSVIVDIASCRSLQSVYVMLSRARGLKHLAILRWFPTHKIYQLLTHEFHTEMDRLKTLAIATKNKHTLRTISSEATETAQCA